MSANSPTDLKTLVERERAPVNDTTLEPVDFGLPPSGWAAPPMPRPTSRKEQRSLRPWHLLLGGVGSSLATALVTLLAVVSFAEEPPEPTSVVANFDAKIHTSPSESTPADLSVDESVAETAPSSTEQVVKTAPTLSEPPKTKKKRVRTGVLTREKITKAVEQHGTNVAPCLKAARRDGEIVPGRYRLTLDWLIRPDGTVSKARLTGPRGALHTSLPRCFADKMLDWKFPVSKTGAPVTNFPFSFGVK